MNDININIGIVDKNIIPFQFNNHTIECNFDFDLYEITYEITYNINKIKKILGTFSNINSYIITFDKRISNKYINIITTKLHDILYCYYPSHSSIILKNVLEYTNNMVKELTQYKDTIMDPNKTPDTFLKYVLSRLPKQYKADVFKIKKTSTKMFTLTQCVGMGSQYNAYFVHIKPKNIKPKGMNIYMVGKSVTYDSGGMNIKIHDMEEMKTDMTGGSIIVSVLNLLKDTPHNIHLLLPIVENMIGSTATKPGMVVTTMNNIKVEIIDTDAEGRLCIADAMEYISLNLIKNKRENNIVINIATLTGNACKITNSVSSLIMGNKKSMKYIEKFIKIGDEIGEYMDFLKLRKEYIDLLKSQVGDIMNINTKVQSDCIMGGVFINYFIDEMIPLIHIDLGCMTFIDKMANSYGINLLYNFINMLE